MPPSKGSLMMKTSPGSRSSPKLASSECIAVGIEPRWSGIVTACATVSPRRVAKRGREVDQSRTTVECAVRYIVVAIRRPSTRRVPDDLPRDRVDRQPGRASSHVSRDCVEREVARRRYRAAPSSRAGRRRSSRTRRPAAVPRRGSVGDGRARDDGVSIAPSRAELGEPRAGRRRLRGDASSSAVARRAERPRAGAPGPRPACPDRGGRRRRVRARPRTARPEPRLSRVDRVAGEFDLDVPALARVRMSAVRGASLLEVAEQLRE